MRLYQYLLSPSLFSFACDGNRFSYSIDQWKTRFIGRTHIIAKDFANFRGHVRIVIDSRLITVHCRKQTNQPKFD